MASSPQDMPTSGLEPECTNCGVSLTLGAAHCHVCGTSVRVGHQQRRCLNCGTPAAQKAQSCLMCNAPLDEIPVRPRLISVSWPWVGGIALIAALVIIGWNYWRSQPQPVSAVPTTTLRATDTPTAASQTATPTSTSSATPSPVPSATPVIHQVQSGETVIFIASYYGTSFEAILEANGLDETSARLLYPGQELVIPSTGPVGGPVPGSTARPPQVIHEVVSGETLISIAYEYDSSVETILAANELDSPDLIYVGQQLVVPLLPPTITPTPTPTSTPSSTPGPPYSAPHLLSPSQDAVFQGGDTEVVLVWASVGILRETQAYLVEVETPAGTTPLTFLTQVTSLRLSSDLRPTGRRNTLTWRVTVVQDLNSVADETPRWQPVSLPSETRRFVWR